MTQLPPPPPTIALSKIPAEMIRPLDGGPRPRLFSDRRVRYPPRMIFSKTAEYGIRAMIHLARSPRGAAIHCQNIALGEKIPPEFLKLILRRLAAKGLVRSATGTNGGFMLNRKAADIRLVDIVIALDEDPCDVQCALGYALCSERQPCPMHHSWQRMRREIRRFLRQQTLAQLARGARSTSPSPLQ